MWSAVFRLVRSYIVFHAVHRFLPLVSLPSYVLSLLIYDASNGSLVITRMRKFVWFYDEPSWILTHFSIREMCSMLRRNFTVSSGSTFIIMIYIFSNYIFRYIFFSYQLYLLQTVISSPVTSFYNKSTQSYFFYIKRRIFCDM